MEKLYLLSVASIHQVFIHILSIQLVFIVRTSATVVGLSIARDTINNDTCMDWWPYCESVGPPCNKTSVNQTIVEKWCPKRCGFCQPTSVISRDTNTTCEDIVNCSQYNLTRDCSSGNTWFMEYCARSCNMCFPLIQPTAETSTTDRTTPEKSSYNTFTVVGAVSVSVLAIIITANSLICIFFIRKHKGVDLNKTPKEKQSSFRDKHLPECTCEAHLSMCESSALSFSDVGDNSAGSDDVLSFQTFPGTPILTRVSHGQSDDKGIQDQFDENGITEIHLKEVDKKRVDKHKKRYSEPATVIPEIWVNEDGLMYATLDFSDLRFKRAFTLPTSQLTDYSAIDFKKSVASIKDEGS